MMKNNRTGNPEFEANGIRKIVWDGKYVETDQRIVRGAVGQTTDGGYKSAEVHLYLERGPSGRISESHESWKWNGKVHPEKDHAIFAARQEVERTINNDRQSHEPVEIQTKAGAKAAQKYGGANETPERSITLPTRSR